MFPLTRVTFLEQADLATEAIVITPSLLKERTLVGRQCCGQHWSAGAWTIGGRET